MSSEEQIKESKLNIIGMMEQMFSAMKQSVRNTGDTWQDIVYSDGDLVIMVAGASGGSGSVEVERDGFDKTITHGKGKYKIKDLLTGVEKVFDSKNKFSEWAADSHYKVEAIENSVNVIMFTKPKNDPKNN